MSKDFWKGIAVGVSSVVGLGVIAKAINKVVYDGIPFEDMNYGNPCGFGCMMHHCCGDCDGLDEDDIDDEDFDGSGDEDDEDEDEDMVPEED